MLICLCKKLLKYLHIHLCLSVHDKHKCVNTERATVEFN